MKYLITYKYDFLEEVQFLRIASSPMEAINYVQEIYNTTGWKYDGVEGTWTTCCPDWKLEFKIISVEEL